VVCRLGYGSEGRMSKMMVGLDMDGMISFVVTGKFMAGVLVGWRG